MHGRLPRTQALLKEAGLEAMPVEGRFYRKEAGAWKEQHEMIEGWDKLLKKMKKADSSTTLYDFLQQEYGTENDAPIRRHAIAYAEGFDVADARKVTVQSLYREWSKEEGDNFRIAGGYGALTHFLEQEAREKGALIYTGDAVRQVDWQEGSAVAYTASGQRYTGDKAMITLPPVLLQQVAQPSSINFTPPLDEYVRAARQIGSGAAIRIVLEFRQPLWPEDTGFIFSDERIPTWWTLLPDKAPVLTGWVGGPAAERLGAETEEALLEKAILSLAAIFELPAATVKENLVAAAVFNWLQKTWAREAYTYAMPGSEAARQQLRTPVANTLFFAGEGLHEGEAPGTVEAAILDAERAMALLRNAAS